MRIFSSYSRRKDARNRKAFLRLPPHAPPSLWKGLTETLKYFVVGNQPRRWSSSRIAINFPFIFKLSVALHMITYPAPSRREPSFFLKFASKTNLPPQINHCEYSIIQHIILKEKRKANGNPTRRPPARLIANYKVFKSFGQAFSKACGVWGGASQKNLRGGSGGKSHMCLRL